MAQQINNAEIINTVIVLRTDQTLNWENSDYRLLKGEVGLGYLDNGNVIAKLGVDGKTAWKDLPQIEGVLEDEITLTHNFGRYTTSNGFVKTTDAKGKTISQWLIHALSEIKEPIITQPSFALTASGSGSSGEIGTYLTALNWNGTATYGFYEYGPSTGLDETNVTWSISNDIDDQTSASEDGAFILTSDKQIQLNQEASKTYATITGTYMLDASGAADPVNNVGNITTGKITDKTNTLTAEIKATAYRKPFYGVLAAGNTVDTSALTSDIIRALPNSGSKTKGLPTSISVPAGSQMVIFAAKADTYKSLTVTDSKAMNAPVSFEKKSAAVQVKGANDFEATAYDIWFVNWGAGIGSAKQLNLSWT